MLYVKWKATKIYPPLEKEIEEAQAIAFQIKANGGSDIGDHSVNFAIILDYDTPV